LDGNTYELSPERAMEIQHLLGSDISMVLDECTPYPATQAQAAESMRLSMRWAERSKTAFGHLKVTGVGCQVSDKNISDTRHPTPVTPLLFGIVQGSIYPELRKESCAA